MRHASALVLPLVVLVACTATPVMTPTPPASARPSERPTAAPSVASDPAPSPTPNRPAHVGAPAIDGPYWLLYQGTSTATFTSQDGSVIETDRSESYQVIEGGSLEGTVLIDGEWTGTLEVTVTEGEATPGLDPIEQQYGAQIDDRLPADGILNRSPNPYWIRTEQQREGLDLFVRVPAHPTDDGSFINEAFWWDTAHEKWYRVSVATDAGLDSVLAALLGPAQG